MSKHNPHRIPAFTIFEVTVVLAIMSVMITMIAYSINRLNEQMKVTSDLHAELDDFYRMRSSLWYDCILADSIVQSNQSFTVHHGKDLVEYNVQNEFLQRSKNNLLPVVFSTPVTSFSNENSENGSEIIIEFQWKDEPLHWRFTNRPEIAVSINQYFEHLDE